MATKRTDEHFITPPENVYRRLRLAIVCLVTRRYRSIQLDIADDAVLPPRYRRSLSILHVDTGSDGSVERELKALSNPYYNMQQYGLRFVANPRHASLLIVTGALTQKMLNPLLYAFYAMPEPRKVIALGISAQRLIAPNEYRHQDDPLYRAGRFSHHLLTDDALNAPRLAALRRCSRYFPALNTRLPGPIAILEVLVTIDPLAEWHNETV